jgi:hypothetical protein
MGTNRGKRRQLRQFRASGSNKPLKLYSQYSIPYVTAMIIGYVSVDVIASML